MSLLCVHLENNPSFNCQLLTSTLLHDPSQRSKLYTAAHACVNHMTNYNISSSPTETASVRILYSTRIVWTPDPSGRARKGLGNNLAWKCLERWNAAVGVDEGKNAFQPTSVRVLLMTGSDIR